MPEETQATPSPTRILRRRDLEARLKLSRSSIYDRLNPKSPQYDPTFPKPISLGASAIGFVEAEVESWLRQKIQARRRAG